MKQGDVLEALVTSRVLRSQKIKFVKNSLGNYEAFLMKPWGEERINWSHEKCLEKIREKNAKYHVTLDIEGKEVKLSLDYRTEEEV